MGPGKGNVVDQDPQELRWSHGGLETERGPKMEAQRAMGTRGQRDPREREKAEDLDSK